MTLLAPSNATSKFFWFWLFILLTLAHAGHAETVRSAHVEAELIAETLSAQPGTQIWTALRMKMAKGWHTYWKNSGDSGLPTQIEWQLPAGVTASAIHWPIPQKIRAGHLTTYGYEGEIYLFSKIQLPASLAPGQNLTLCAKAVWLSCQVECLPGEGEFEISLPVATDPPSINPRWDESVRQAFRKLPEHHNRNELIVRAAANAREVILSFPNAKNHFLFRESISWTGVKAQFFPDSPGWMDHGAKQKWSRSSGTYQLCLKRSSVSAGPLQSVSGLLVFTPYPFMKFGLEIDAEVSDLLPPSGGSSPPVWGYLFFAFLGGILLNLMPCVLPVLSLKILGIVEQSKKDRSHAFVHGISFTSGVLVSFWILTGLLILIRNSGEEIGWGFQLQQPEFIIFLILLFFALTLNLFGVFEVGLSLTGIGPHPATQKGYLGSFLSGLLATVVATPCTAPFMGSALGFGLSQPVAISFLIFTLLGFGMAFPYLLLTLNPKAVGWIPKPGQWMIPLKKFLGLLLAATCLWLFWILSLQTEVKTLTAVVISLSLIGWAAHLYGKSQTSAEKNGRTLLAIAVLLAIAGVLAFAVVRTKSTNSKRAVSGESIFWQPYSPQILDESLKQGKPVFIDFTAAWCLTCQVNERLALNHPDVREKFKELGVVALKADWTRKDDLIAQALAGYGRNSIPLYVLHPAEGKTPLLLPEIITPKIVLEYLEENL